jgi:uncharacterized protein (UPF0332 family)
MDSLVKLYLERAENKLLLSKMNFDISSSTEYKHFLKIPIEKTFFNDVISDSYYAIFYAAKAFLLSKNIETKSPEEHKKTYKEFQKIVLSGELDASLLYLYEAEITKAEALLNIFFEEKRKRGIFTYNVKSEANVPYAQESLHNSKKFVSLIKAIVLGETK